MSKCNTKAANTKSDIRWEIMQTLKVMNPKLEISITATSISVDYIL